MSRILENVDFVHLHVHSSFSLLEGALRIDDLKKLALKDQMPALALTDTNNLFGALEFSEKMAGAGIQPIVGIQISVEMADGHSPKTMALVTRPSLVLLAATDEGYSNLMHLSSRAFLDPEPGEGAYIRLVDVLEHSDGLIVLTGGPTGPIDQALRDGQSGLAEQRLKRLSEAFGNRLYIELQRHGLDTERRTEGLILDLAYRLSVPIVATNCAYFANEDQFGAHDALLAIAEGRVIGDPDRRRVTSQHYFKSRVEMVKLFADLPEALVNTVEIAMRCASRPRTRKPILPNFTVGDLAGIEGEARELRRQAEDGLQKRLLVHGPSAGLSESDYRDRLAFELGVIERMKYPGYFLIVADFIKWAKAHGIPVGPGRGSGAGSLVAYATTITDLDPLRFGLLFERFLNPDRVSMPDFDIDFCQDRRDEVIRYVQNKYGTDRVAQIITFGTLQARGVIRDVGRVLEVPYRQVDQLTKLVPQNPANPVTLEKAIAEEPKLRAAADQEPVVRRLLDVALVLEGLHRHASTHAAGIVIGDRPLQELVPLYRDPKSDMLVTQFNMKWVEPAGLVKFDFLGLKTLTVISLAEQLIRARGDEIAIENIVLDDKKTFDMLGRGETVGVFQLESVGMRKALAEMRADRFEDIIALVALYRPGPMANIPVYNACKLGHETPDYIHPKLESCLKETYGVIIYQEQVMQIAQILSGYSLGEADLLRRAMGKKINAEMDAQRERFVSGAMERGLDKATSNTIFDLLAKFADYGFNKSHAAAYALVAYQTAFLKANYPLEFMAASMTLDMSNTDKLSEFRREVQRLGFKVEPPSINRSGVTFEVHPDREGLPCIRYALAALKGVGRQAVESLVATRQGAPFQDVSDLARRINPRLFNKRTLESLISAGAMDEIEPDRARAFASIEAIIAEANRSKDEASAGQSDIFGGLGKPVPLRISGYKAWSNPDRLQREYDAIGFFLSGHPLDEYSGILRRLRVQSWVEFVRAVKSGATAGKLAATVLDRTERRTRTGNKMGILSLSDQTGHFESIIFQEGLVQYRELLEPGTVVILSVQASVEGDEVRSRIQSVEPLEQVAARLPSSIRVAVNEAATVPAIASELKERGDGEVFVVVSIEGGTKEVEIKLPGRFRATPQLAGSLRMLSGVSSVEHA